MLLIECILGLTESDEDFVEDLLPHCHHLLEQLGFEGGITCSLTRPEAMEYIMKLYRRHDLTIDDSPTTPSVTPPQ